MTFTGTLTPEQIAATVELRDQWMGRALSTDRCDRDAAVEAVHAAYTAAGLTPPPITIWMDSPLSGVLAKIVLVKAVFPALATDLGQLRGQLEGQLEGQLRGQLWGQLRGQLRGQLEGQLRGQLWGQLRGQLRGQLWGQLGGQLWGQLGGQLRGQLEGQLRGQLEGQLRGQLWGQLGGQLWGQLGGQLDPWWEPYWLALYRRAFEAAEIEISPRLATMTAAVWETGWWWPMRGTVVMCDRPTHIGRDARGRLHGETGPALTWADGWSGSWWHGVHVPDDLVTGDGWPVERIMRERNSEIRRCGIERLGWDRFIASAGLSRIGDEVPDPGNPGQLLGLYELPADLADLYDAPARILLCANASLDRDGTRRRFGHPVPADISDPVAAAASLFDVAPDEYAGLARAT